MAAYLGAEDDPFIVFDADVTAMLTAVEGLIQVTNKDIQDNKAKFTARELTVWHQFVEEWLKWRNAYMAQSTVMRATSGNWMAAKDWKRRALEWANNVETRLGVTTPGKPKPPAPETHFWESPFAWALVGVLGVISVGYTIRSFGVSSITRARGEKIRTAARIRAQNDVDRRARQLQRETRK